MGLQLRAEHRPREPSRGVSKATKASWNPLMGAWELESTKDMLLRELFWSSEVYIRICFEEGAVSEGVSKLPFKQRAFRSYLESCKVAIS